MGVGVGTGVAGGAIDGAGERRGGVRRAGDRGEAPGDGREREGAEADGLGAGEDRARGEADGLGDGDGFAGEVTRLVAVTWAQASAGQASSAIVRPSARRTDHLQGRERRLYAPAPGVLLRRAGRGQR